MRAFFDPVQRKHDPKHFLTAGVIRPSPEEPARADVLVAALETLGVTPETPPDAGIEPIAAVHSADYIAFLRTIYRRWQAIDGAADEVIPNVHPDRASGTYPRSPVGQAGWHQADTACPISAGTWPSAYASAQAAVAASDTVIGGAGAAYALCRPPGHHAYRDLAGGFCFLNNSAIAAARAVAAGLRPAILDVDLHHGNGTQGIFYDRGDVLTVSIHADPHDFYPFFWGHPHETGAGPGVGANLNLALPLGTGDAGFLDALGTGLDRIAAFDPDIQVVALGLDAFEGDPFGGLTVTTAGFARIGERIGRTGLATVIVQEGGYLCPALGDNFASFLTGFRTPPR